ncbi:MAG: hypothetical protein D6814_16180 [Calditrichaeota bacterium]|nr:MAG: hypothetical protein D6814_16180 [Calditrichota bacterium]
MATAGPPMPKDRKFREIMRAAWFCAKICRLLVKKMHIKINKAVVFFIMANSFFYMQFNVGKCSVPRSRQSRLAVAAIMN